MNKSDSLECVALQYDPHVIAITKTWLYNDITDFEIFPPHYNVVRQDKETRGGGVAILVKILLKYEAVPGITDHESDWRKLFIDDVILLIGGISGLQWQMLHFSKKCITFSGLSKAIQN